MLFRWLTWAVSGQPNYILTSRPYAVEVVEETEAVPAIITDIRYTNQSTGCTEATDANGPLITAGLLEQTFFLVEYDNYPTEATDANSPAITNGNLYDASSPIIPYSYEEATDANVPSITAGLLVQTFFLIDYTNYPAEATDAMPPTITGGTLS